MTKKSIKEQKRSTAVKSRASGAAAVPSSISLEDSSPAAVSLDDLAPWFNGELDLKVPSKCIHFRPLQKSCLAPVAVGDLLLVEQELCGYETGEIAQIENIMARERKEFSTRDLNRVTESTESSFEREAEESQASKIDERFSLSVQLREAQSQQTAVSGSVSASYKAPTFSATINANASYSNSKDSSYATSQEYAKNITEEATKRVREAVSESKKLTIVTESTKTSLHGFDNSEGDIHIRGIYRWVDKNYKAQLFDFGRRLFLTLRVPEPAHFLRDIDSLIEREELVGLGEPPVHPRDRKQPILRHEDIDEGDYGKLAADYDVTDIAPPPPRFLVKGKGIAHPDADQGTTDENRADKKEPTLSKAIGSIVIEQGYHLTEWQANIPQVEVPRPDKNGPNPDFKYGYYTTVGFSNDGGDVNILLVNVLGTNCYYLTHNDGANDNKHILVDTDRFNVWHPSDHQIEGEIPITVSAEFEGSYDFNLMYKMERNDETLALWQIDTYQKVLQGYKNKLQEYEQKRKEAELARDTEIGELKVQLRAEAYSEIISNELRKHCIDVITRHSAFSDQPLKLKKVDGRMEINLDGILGIPNWQANNVNGATAAFFEKAFEWESMTYQLFPYFWTDRSRWHQLYQEMETGDALFDQFLKAGFAEIVLPMRPHYERSALYFLRTKMIWEGGEVPAFDDDAHLSLLEELHESAQVVKGNGTPFGEPWDVKVPTNLIYLQEESDLPQFDCSLGTASDGGAVELPSEEEVEQQEAELEALIKST